VLRRRLLSHSATLHLSPQSLPILHILPNRLPSTQQQRQRGTLPLSHLSKFRSSQARQQLPATVRHNSALLPFSLSRNPSRSKPPAQLLSIDSFCIQASTYTPESPIMLTPSLTTAQKRQNTTPRATGPASPPTEQPSFYRDFHESDLLRYLLRPREELYGAVDRAPIRPTIERRGASLPRTAANHHIRFRFKDNVELLDLKSPRPFGLRRR
jgi:hypothetical protein